MGRRIQGQRRGRGSPTFRAPSHRYKATLSHKAEAGDLLVGEVTDIEHDPARSAPVARVAFEDGDERLVLAPEGIGVGDRIEVGISAAIEPGNTLPLSEIPEGIPIVNVEAQPGDGGKYARASGVSADLVTHERDAAVVKLPSDEVKRLSPDCRATIGVVAGGGRTEKPFVKAGSKYHKMKSRGTKWPRVRGVAMNAVDHPFGGGGRQHPGRPKSVSKNAPPGRKVGDLGSRRTGRGGN
ncbi:MAG: 50S ribosomal protein L2 [Halodesulfurarchaeum sp.]|nr:50S ribosomal protein L2 [Halodesulfurarchaeum sp.]